MGRNTMAKQWTNTPPWTNQYDVKSRTDALDCVAESLINIIYEVTGFDGSPRALAKLSGTTTSGNSLKKVMDTINQYGIIPYSLWPTPDYFDWITYYNEIPTEILKQAIPIKVAMVSADLNTSPLWTIIQWGIASPGVIPTSHAVCQINDIQYFDSEQGSPIKPLNYEGAKITSQTSLIIKIMVTCTTVRFADNKTMGIMIDSPNGVQIIKATGEEQWRSWSKPDSYGKETIHPDGTTNWTFEKQLNF